jgi:CRISPR-associated protein Csm3
MKLSKIVVLKGEIELLSGLHIGAGNDEIRIGGVDSPVVRNPLTEEPYIPGSSLKGKIRTLLEWYEGKVAEGGKVWSSKEARKKSGNDVNKDIILNLFGNGETDENYKGGPSRLSFSDCFLTKESSVMLRDKGCLTEEKAEVSIDRVKGTAAGFGPRHMERVPAGARFSFSVSCKIFEPADNEEELIKLLKTGMKLLELDALGGSGSRGYGKLRFELTDDSLEDIKWQS